MNVRISWVCAMECMCTDYTLVYTLIQNSFFLGIESEPMLTPRKKSLKLRGWSYPWCCIMQDSEPNTLPTELFESQSPEQNMVHTCEWVTVHHFKPVLVLPEKEGVMAFFFLWLTSWSRFIRKLTVVNECKCIMAPKANFVRLYFACFAWVQNLFRPVVLFWQWRCMLILCTARLAQTSILEIRKISTHCYQVCWNCCLRPRRKISTHHHQVCWSCCLSPGSSDTVHWTLGHHTYWLWSCIFQCPLYHSCDHFFFFAESGVLPRSSICAQPSHWLHSACSHFPVLCAEWTDLLNWLFLWWALPAALLF